MKTAQEYIDSLKARDITVYIKGVPYFGAEVVEHPFIKGHVNSASKTYELAFDPKYEDLMTATSHLSGKKINRFTHIHQSAEDLVKKVKMLRLLSQQTGSCYQRCVGLDGPGLG